MHYCLYIFIYGELGKGTSKYSQQKIAGMLDDNITCGICGEKAEVDTFWIACDTCNRWFHGECTMVPWGMYYGYPSIGRENE